MKNLPFTVDDLIEQLDKSIPERCPQVNQAEREIWIYSGKRELINTLIRLQKKRDDNLE